MEPLGSPNTQPPTSFRAQVRVLIVEDDRTMEPLWRYVVEAASPGALVEWLTSGEAAVGRLREKQKYDLLISDIFFGGQTTGLDLWAEARTDSQCAFILMSVITPQRLSILAQGADVSGLSGLPSYLQKPLDPHQCIETVRTLLRTRA